MTRKYIAALAAALVAAAAGCAAQPKSIDFSGMSFDDRPFSFRHNIELFETSNGMKVALIPDSTTNLATVDIRFDVGSTEDPAGRTGLAHLVEHLVFQYRAVPGGPTIGDELGEVTLSHNAFTSWDYTHYTSSMLIDNLPKVILLEGRRWQSPCSQLDEATFKREIDVVLQETRQRGQNPFLTVLADVFGKDHPYARQLSTEEVAATTRDEFCAFVEKHYAPDRAYMVVTGNFNTNQIADQIGRTFGPIKRKAGPRPYVSAAQLDGRTTRYVTTDDSAVALVFLPFPSWGGDDIAMWDVMRGRLSSAMSAADAKLAWIENTLVFPWFTDRQRVLVVAVQVTHERRLDEAVDEVFERIKTLREVPEAGEQHLTRGAASLAYVSSWDERSARGMWISEFMQYTKDNWFMLKELRALQETKFDVVVPGIVDQWTREESHIALVAPGDVGAAPEAAVSATQPGNGTTHQTTPWRAPVDAADADRPLEIKSEMPARRIEDFHLDNGLRVVLAPSADSQMLDARLIFPAGRAHEPADRPLVATAASYLLTFDLETEYWADSLLKLAWVIGQGTVLDATVDETTTTFMARGSAQWGDWHVWLLGWLVQHGRYDKRALRAVRRYAEKIDAAEDEAEDDMVTRTFRERLYGAGHPYANPPGFGAALQAIAESDLKAWRAQRFRANGATLVVSGGFDAAKMRNEIAEHFGDWDDGAPPPLPSVAPIRPADKPSWLAVPAVDATQTRVTIAMPAASDAEKDRLARDVLQRMLEDGLRDIREGMGATYGIGVWYDGGPAGSSLNISALVDNDRAPEAIERMLAIVDGMARDAAGQREAFVRARKKALAQMIARAGGAGAVAGELQWALAGGHDTELDRRLAAGIAAMTPADVAKVAAADLATQRRIVMVRGKRPAVDAVFARLAVTPEYIGNEAKAAAEGATASATTPDPVAEDTAEEPPPPPREQRDYLFLGDERARAEHEPGKYYLGSRELSLDEFLALGKANYVAKRVKRRRIIRTSMLVGAVVGVVGGIGLALAGGQCDAADFTNQNDLDNCVSRRDGMRLGGVIMAGTGVGLVIARGMLGDGKPSTDELLEIADRYNNEKE
jgi:zinc protease